MKKILLALIPLLLITGCSFTNNFDSEIAYATSYPIEYALKMLYTDTSVQVSSIYPSGSNETYEVTEKKKDMYAQGTTFVYSGISNEASLTRDLLNKNNKLQIIDATKGISQKVPFTSIWLNPSNYLMLCSNVKTALIEYENNVYLKEQIENNYIKLNEKVSELDVELYDIGTNGNYNSILTTSSNLAYLAKYNINVISIDEKEENQDKAYADAKKLIEEKKIQYIYTIKGDTLTETQEKFLAETTLIKIELDNLFTLTEEQKSSDDNYITVMNKIIDEYKKELYKSK